MSQTHAVIGFGITGQSVVRHLQANATPCVVFDTRAPTVNAASAPSANIHWQIDNWSQEQLQDHLGNVQRVVVSPGLSLDLPILQVARDLGLPLVSDIDLFFEATAAPVIGVTGTNGKSTVVSLLGQLFQGAALTCGVGGNIGRAALDLLAVPQSRYVLELSSFQLERSALLPLEAATVLNVSDDHIDHHGSLQNYQRAKQRIYRNAQRCVFNRDDPSTRPDTKSSMVSFGLQAPEAENHWGIVRYRHEPWIARGDQPVAALKELPLLGNHNALNVMAAFALAAPVLDIGAASTSLATFAPLDHRLQRVAVVDDVLYVNDSKATNVGATLAALQGLAANTRVVLIGGGDAKGADLSVLTQALSSYAAAVVAMGKDAESLLAVARTAGVKHCTASDMTEAVVKAQRLATGADMVLLSPACSSLDMYRNFAERGQDFTAAVHALAHDGESSGGVL